jgi:hypothetical protein
MRPEPLTDFVDIVLGEPFRIHVTISGHLAEDLVAIEPTLR